jgi:arylsulfatase A-like enzyme
MTEGRLRRAMAYYYATISQIDHQVGRLLDVLRGKGLYDNTLVLFTSDHGDYMGFHHLILKSGHMYDPLAKVPLIMRFPDGRRAGEVSRQLVSNVDVAPTLLSQAGIAPPAEMAGLDLSDEQADRDWVCCGGRPGGATMVRSLKRKLIRVEPREKSLFFDLEKDPYELDNLFDEPARQEEIERFEQARTTWLATAAADWERTYLDERAPRIQAPNVQSLDDGHREEIAGWYEARMRELDAR